jgi:hypothetical protein
LPVDVDAAAAGAAEMSGPHVHDGFTSAVVVEVQQGMCIAWILQKLIASTSLLQKSVQAGLPGRRFLPLLRTLGGGQCAPADRYPDDQEKMALHNRANGMNCLQREGRTFR